MSEGGGEGGGGESGTSQAYFDAKYGTNLQHHDIDRNHKLTKNDKQLLEKYAPFLNLNCKKFEKRAIYFLRREAENRNKQLTIGLSGGVDSAVIAALCKKTGIDTKPVIVYDNKYSIEKDIKDAKKICEHIGLEHKLIDASELYHKNFEKITINPHTMMGFRRALIYNFAEQENRMVVSAGNKTELYFGIMNPNSLLGDVLPIINLYKTQVLQLADHLKLPKEIVKKPSHSGIKDESKDKTLFGSLEVSDIMAYLLFENNLKYHMARFMYIPQRGRYYEDFKKIIKTHKKNIKQNITNFSFPELKYQTKKLSLLEKLKIIKLNISYFWKGLI
jgi:NAD+ synthase